MALAIANRYARALADVVLDASSGLEPREAVRQLFEFEFLLAQAPELRTILLNPAVPPARKRAVISRLAEPLGASPLIRNFLCVVIDRRRIGVLSEIRQAFEDLLDERLGIVRADVTSPRQLSEEQRSRLREELAKLTGKQVRCEFEVEDNLLGGAVVQMGSTIYDGSLRGQLETLRQRLVE